MKIKFISKINMNNKNYMNNKINSKIIYMINLSINRVHNNFRNVIGNGIKKYSTVSSFKDVEGNVNVNVNVNVIDVNNEFERGRNGFIFSLFFFFNSET